MLDCFPLNNAQRATKAGAPPIARCFRTEKNRQSVRKSIMLLSFYRGTYCNACNTLVYTWLLTVNCSKNACHSSEQWVLCSLVLNAILRWLFSIWSKLMLKVLCPGFLIKTETWLQNSWILNELAHAINHFVSENSYH